MAFFAFCMGLIFATLTDSICELLNGYAEMLRAKAYQIRESHGDALLEVPAKEVPSEKTSEKSEKKEEKADA